MRKALLLVFALAALHPTAARAVPHALQPLLDEGLASVDPGGDGARITVSTDRVFPDPNVLEDLQLSDDGRRIAEVLASYLAAHPLVRCRLEGHTDSTGSGAFNRKRSVSHVLKMKNALIRAGVAADRIETLAHGEDAPVSPNDTPEGKARNRRIEIVLINPS